MASYQIPAPPPMSLKGDVVENWREFENAWQYYIIATNLRAKLKKGDGSDDPEGMEIVAATLCTIMGPECKKVMNSLPTLSDDDKKKPARIIEELQKHFIPQRNVLYERFMFNSASQKSSESIDEYVLRLRQLSESCEFGDLKDSLIRDRIVIGTSDEGGRERLLRERPVPDLDKVIQSLRAAEISRTHKQAITGKMEAAAVDFTNKFKNRSTSSKKKPVYRRNLQIQETPKLKHTGRRDQSSNKMSSSSSSKCKWCGKDDNHFKKNCPAKDSKCYKCSKVGHYSSVCHSSKSVYEVEDEFEDIIEDSFMLGEVKSSSDDFWSVDVFIDKNITNFKLDCGSKVTIIDEKTPWLKDYKLTPVASNFLGPGGVPLSHLIKGKIPNAVLEIGNRKRVENVYVMTGQLNNLLSKSAIEALRLLKPAKEVYNVESDQKFKEEFPKLFKGLGLLKSKYRISLREGAIPYCRYTPNNIAHPLLPKVKKKLQSMVEQKVISPVTVPTEWCSGMVDIMKPNKDVRICVDLTSLNKAVKREIHPMASVEENLAKLQGSTVFTKLDANSGFWQMPLDEESRLLTTFVTPFGRFCFNRLPFGISSAPEIFQRTMTSILEGLEGVVCHMDDILIHGPTQESHDSRVREVLRRLQEAGLTLNDKCEFSKRQIKFLGHIISEKGIEADPGKTKAVQEFPRPKNVTELQRFNGMVNQLAKFIPDLANINEPLRQLLKKSQQWLWDQPQEDAFQLIKRKLVSTEILAHYNPNKRCIVAADACQDGLGGVLLQFDDSGHRRPIAYASRSLSETEKRYAVIEKEALAATWSCEKFKDYILGTTFTLETDHRPLVPLLASTDLSKLPPRILRFRLRLARYSPEVTYVQGVHQNTADALSRAPTSLPTKADLEFIEEVEEFQEASFKVIPATERRLEEIKEAQEADAICQQVLKFCLEGWPSIMPSQPLLKPYWEKKQHLTVSQGLLMFNNRIVIPTSLQLEVLDALHEGHLGITKCQGRASYSVWWPLITKQIESMVNKCHVCAKLRPEPKESLIALSFPEKPWSRIGTDLFELEGKSFVIVVDYSSRWFEFRELKNTTTIAVTTALSDIFSIHGIPEIVVSDNGPQYSSYEFKEFAKCWGFTHVTSSPLHPQANGEAERAVQTAKNILKKNANPYLGLLAYRSAPLRNGLTPSEILMSRKIRTKLPVLPDNLVPKECNKENLLEKEENYREKYSRNFNNHHRIQKLPVLQTGDKVYVRDQERYGEVTERLNQPRSYKVLTDTGSVIRRNRRSLIHTGEHSSSLRQDTPTLLSASDDSSKPSEISQNTSTTTVCPNTEPCVPSPSRIEVRRSSRVPKPNVQPEMMYY